MITGRRLDKLSAELTIRTHKIISGLSEKLGGSDEGPNPHEILESALAACTILTVQMYADRKGIKVDSIDAKVTITQEGPESIIGREVSFTGDLTNEEKNRLCEIAEKCPIHKLLESHIKIETTVR